VPGALATNVKLAPGTGSSPEFRNLLGSISAFDFDGLSARLLMARRNWLGSAQSAGEFAGGSVPGTSHCPSMKGVVLTESSGTVAVWISPVSTTVTVSPTWIDNPD